MPGAWRSPPPGWVGSAVRTPSLTRRRRGAPPAPREPANAAGEETHHVPIPAVSAGPAMAAIHSPARPRNRARSGWTDSPRCSVRRGKFMARPPRGHRRPAATSLPGSHPAAPFQFSKRLRPPPRSSADVAAQGDRTQTAGPDILVAHPRAAPPSSNVITTALDARIGRHQQSCARPMPDPAPVTRIVRSPGSLPLSARLTRTGPKSCSFYR